MLAAASVAVGIPGVDGNYTGTTTQRNPTDHHHWIVSFSISHHFVRNLDFNINDKCPDGTHLIVHSFGYPPMKIHPKGKFGGRFGVMNGVPGEGSLIRGQVSGQTVTAQIDDFGLNKSENILCHGAASFSAKPAAAPGTLAATDVPAPIATAATAAPAPATEAPATATADPRYSGKTAQGRTISFSVSGGYVRKLSYRIYDRCPGGRAIIDWDRGFTPIRIKADGRFGGKFVDPGKANAVVSGKVSGKWVTGALTDTAKHPHYHTTCRGHTTFKLMPN